MNFLEQMEEYWAKKREKSARVPLTSAFEEVKPLGDEPLTKLDYIHGAANPLGYLSLDRLRSIGKRRGW